MCMNSCFDRHRSVSVRDFEGGGIARGMRADVDCDFGDRDGVAEGNDIRASFGSHDACDPCDTENIALFVEILGDESVGFYIAEVDEADSHGDSICRFLLADINHMGFAGRSEMSQSDP